MGVDWPQPWMNWLIIYPSIAVGALTVAAMVGLMVRLAVIPRRDTGE